jgi:hypothetical protein
VLFAQLFTDLDDVILAFAMLVLMVLAACAVASAVVAAAVATLYAPLPPVRRVHQHWEPIPSDTPLWHQQWAALRTTEQDTSGAVVTATATAAAAAVKAPLVLQPLPVSQRQLLFWTTRTPLYLRQLERNSVREADAEQERREKEFFEKSLAIWSDKHLVFTDNRVFTVDNSKQRTQLVKNYLQRRYLLDGIYDTTCYNRDAR